MAAWNPQANELFLTALEVASAERGRFLEQACAGDIDLRRAVHALLAAHEGPGSILDNPRGTLELGPHGIEEFMQLFTQLLRLPRFKVGEQPLPGVDLLLEELLGVGGMGELLGVGGLLEFVGKAVGNALGAGIAGEMMFDVIPEVAKVGYKWWKGRKPEEQQADLVAVANASPEEVKEQAKQIVEEVAADKPPEVKKDLEIYLSLIPGQVRRSLRRPSDPQGRTATLAQVPKSVEEFRRLLPQNLPRFKVGEQPLPGVDLLLEELLGVGGMGEVWKASNPWLDMPPVALKFCLDDGAAQYLRNEAAVLSRVMKYGRHPNIVTLEHTYLRCDTPCLQYEYVEGGDLAGLIKEWHAADSKPSATEITRVFLKLAEVIGYAHSQTPPIVHRDLKPANVLRQIKPDGTSVLKVADFGIGGLATRHAIKEQGRPRTQASHGLFLATALRGSCTPLYASVQQMRGDSPDPRDDVYALGVIWFQMITGDLSARPGGMWAKKAAKCGLEQPLIDVMGKCFDDDVDDRIPDAMTLATVLAQALGVPPTAPEMVAPRRAEHDVTISHDLPPPQQTATPLPLAPSLRRPDVADEKEQVRLEDLRQRLARLAGAIDATPEDARAWAERGEIHRQLGKFEEAIGDCTQAVLLDPNLASAYATRGGAYRMKRDYDTAIADCTRAIQIDPASVLAWYQRGESHRMKTRLDRAIADLSEAVKLDPQYYWAVGARGAAHQQKGDHAKAIADLDETIRLEPSYAWAWAVRAETYRLRQEYDRAIVDCNEALKLRPNLAMAYATRGAAFRQKGDFDAALADLRQAIRLEPGSQFARDQQRLAEQKRK